MIQAKMVVKTLKSQWLEPIEIDEESMETSMQQAQRIVDERNARLSADEIASGNAIQLVSVEIDDSIFGMPDEMADPGPDFWMDTDDDEDLPEHCMDWLADELESEN